MYSVTPKQAVTHPNWSMGAKISVDSATMLNKGLEVIEAHYLFSMPSEKIKVIVHPESIIHSMVYYSDGSVLAQLGISDMKIPISYSLAWPERMKIDIPTLDLSSIGQLNFYEPDLEKFPMLKLARQSLEEANGSPIALNAANEIAVAAFLEGKITFLNICDIVRNTLDKGSYNLPKSIEEVIAIDLENRKLAEMMINSNLSL